MEAVMVGAFFTTFLPKLWEVIHANHLQRYQIGVYIRSIQDDLPIVAASIRDHELLCIGRPQSEKSQKIIQKARRLTQRVDDCICRFLLYQNGDGDSKGLSHQFFEVELKELKEQIGKINVEVSSLTSSTTIPEEPRDRQFGKHEFVGTGVPIEELVALLGCVMRGEQTTKTMKGKLKVISIVGIGGSGKTRLAEEVCEEIGPQFAQQPLVCKRGLEGNHNTVLQYVDNHAKQRYLVVIDDLRSTTGWNILMEELATRDSDVGSRIIVTTTSQAVAEHCRSRGGHVYRMRALSEEHSKELLYEAIGEQPTPTRQIGLQRLVDICDGLPLAVIESADTLKNDVSAYEEAILKLSTSQGTSRMPWVLTNEYSGLASYGAKACLLYFHMFPPEDLNKRNFLTRLWLAEALVQRDGEGTDLKAALKYLKTFRDGNIIRSMEVSKNDTVKSCRLAGTMHEFISRQSKSQDFIRFVTNNGEDPDRRNAEYVRRLSVHAGAAKDLKCIDGVDLLLLRTLAVSGLACKLVMDFSKYAQLVVLNLKKWVYKDHELQDKLKDISSKKKKDKLKDIWKLVMLKYLGLPGSIGEIPRIIERLIKLETLDVDVGETIGTEIVEVCTEVIKLPQLKHLLGKLRLSTDDSYKNGVPEDSRLETFSGFVNNGKGVLPQLMKHMDNLRKVKMWCDSNIAEKELVEVSTAIQGFISLGLDDCVGVVRSLSIDVEGCQVRFLESLKASGKLTKLKLHGNLDTVPEFITALDSLMELCLSSTTLCMKSPQNGTSHFPIQGDATFLPFLIHLKLVEDEVGDLKILKNHFQMLERICLVGKTSIKNITIEAGALQSLVSLHVICESLDCLAGIEIEGLIKLKEIALDSKVSKKTKDAWKVAARDHPNQPQVLLIEAARKP